MEYYVHAVARTHSFYDDIVVKLPIVIVGDKVDKKEENMACLRMVGTFLPIQGPVEKEVNDAPPEDAEDDDGDEVLIDMDEEDEEVEGEGKSADDEKGDEADEDGEKGSDDEEESLGEILGDGDSD